MFTLEGPTKDSLLYSKVTDTRYSTILPVHATAEDGLRTLGGPVDDDIFILLPSPDGGGYVLDGFVTCCPNGFDTSRKLGLKLRKIHRSVPDYKQKLEGSMDRYFDRLPVNKFVRRENVGVKR